MQSASASSGEAQSFQAIFRNAHGRSDFIHLLKQLVSAGSHSENGSDGASDTMSSENGGDQDAVHSEGNGRDPGFFSGNIGGLMSAFARLDSEEVSEKDLGSKVLQTITYRWKN